MLKEVFWVFNLMTSVRSQYLLRELGSEWGQQVKAWLCVCES